MRKLKNFSRAIIAVAMMLITAFDSLAHDFEVDGIYYNITYSTDKTVAVTFSGSSHDEVANEYSGDVTIPASVVYNDVLYTISSIGIYAFWDCSGLTSVTIPNSVTSIGVGAFSDCSGLTEVTIGNSVTSIDDDAFAYCSGLTEVTIGNSVTSIGDYAFRDCSGLTSVTIGNSVTSIGESAFWGCSGLTEVTIPNSVTSIGNYVFSDCSGLTSIVVEGGNTNYDSRDNCNAIIETSTNTLISGCKNTIIPNSVTSIGGSAFSGCSGLTEVTIPNSVTSIGTYAFESCSGLTSVTIGNSVTSIGHFAFAYCSGLTSVTIGNSVTSIGRYVFESCSGLTSVTIPNSVTSIGPFAFRYCSGLTSVTIGNSVTSIGGLAFAYCSGLTKVTSLNPEPPTCGSGGYRGVDVANCTLEVPAGAKEAYGSADCWSYFGNIVEIATVEVSTQENNATFEIPTTQGAVSYTVNVYSDEAMTQLVATANYDASGSVIPMSTSLELSIDGFADGSYYYDVIAKSESGETLSNYTGSFAIDTTRIEGLTSDETTATEVARYDIHGRLLSAPAKGINIVKYSDGTVMKIIHN